MVPINRGFLCNHNVSRLVGGTTDQGIVPDRSLLDSCNQRREDRDVQADASGNVPSSRLFIMFHTSNDDDDDDE
jgi:hypothetical protein